MGSGTHDGGGSRSFEAALEALEAIVARLESGALNLEDALAAFETGVRLARECEARLDQAERRVELLLRAPDGSLQAGPFPVSPRAAAEPAPPDADGPQGEPEGAAPPGDGLRTPRPRGGAG